MAGKVRRCTKCFYSYRRQRSLGVVREVFRVIAVCLCVCLSVCAQDVPKLLTDLNQILWKDRLLAKDQSVRFWEWSGLWIHDEFFHFSNMERHTLLVLLSQNVVDECSSNFWEGRSSDKEHLIKFLDWSESSSGSRIIFFTFAALRHMAFLSLNRNRITQKNVCECSWFFGTSRPSVEEHLIRFWDWSRSGSVSRISFSTLPSLRDCGF